MEFYDWRKGIVARLTEPYLLVSERWNRQTFVPAGTLFRTEHTRRGNPQYFTLPVTILDDLYLPGTNMTHSQEALYPKANFLFEVSARHPFSAVLVDDSDVVEEWYAVERMDQVREANAYLQIGKAVNYLVQLANKGYSERPMLLHRHGDQLHQATIAPLWYTNVARVVKVQIAEHAVRGMKTRIKQNLTPEHEYVSFVVAQRNYNKGDGVERIRRDFAEFRRLLSPGALSSSYLTEAKSGLTSPPNLDIANFYAFLHNEEDRVLMRIAYGDDMTIQDLTV